MCHMTHLGTHNAMPVTRSEDRGQGMATLHAADTLLGGPRGMKREQPSCNGYTLKRTSQLSYSTQRISL